MILERRISAIRQILKQKSSEFSRISADTGVSRSTLYNILWDKKDVGHKILIKIDNYLSGK